MADIGICIPYYRTMHPATAKCLIDLDTTSEHTYTVHSMIGYPNIDHARALALTEWALDNHTHLLTLDSDIWWAPGSIDKLVAHDRPVVCGAYPYKAPEGHPLHQKPVAVALKPEHQNPLSSTILLSRVGGGFILLKRSVLERLWKVNKDLRFDLPVNKATPKNEGKLGYGLWLPFIHHHPNGYREYLTDDWALCQRILNAGYEIHLDPTVHLRHCEGKEFYEIANTALEQELQLALGEEPH